MIRRIVPLVVLLVGLAGFTGCTLAPEYSRPTPPIPSSWPSGPAYKADSISHTGSLTADLGWRTFYADERLRKVIDLALANNRDLKIAVLNIEKTRAYYRIQYMALLPAVEGKATKTEQRFPVDLSSGLDDYSLPAATISRSYSLTVGTSSYEIDLFGRIQSLKDQALEQYLATEEAQRSARISLIAEVANAYLALAADRERLRLAQETLKAQQTSYDLIEKRFTVGASSELDLRQIQTRVDAARADMAFYTGLTAQDENALTLLVGSQVPSDLLPKELGSGMILNDIAMNEVPSEALLRRPDILQAEHQLKSANANIGAARAAFFPKIALTTNVGTSSAHLSGLFGAGSRAWTFIPEITIPIFERGLNWANLTIAKADREIMINQYEKAIQKAFREVADALAQRGTVGDQIAAQESLVDATAQTYRLSDARYNMGIDSYLSVLDAQRSLYSAQQGLIAMRLAKLTNLATLYKALGGSDGKNSN